MVQSVGSFCGVEAVAAADAEPVGVEDAVAAARRARAAPAAVVLQAAADVVRLPHVGADCVELADRQRVHVLPRVRLVVADVEPAVVADRPGDCRSCGSIQIA